MDLPSSDLPMSRSLRALVTIGFAATFAVLIGGGAAGYASGRELINFESQVRHSHDIIVGLEALLSTVKDAETGQRGYLLTQNPQFLTPYHDAVGRIGDQIARVGSAVASDSGELARFGVLSGVIDRKVAELRRTINLLDAGDRAGALTLVQGGSGKSLMDSARAVGGAMQQLEQQRRYLLSAEVSAATDVAQVWVVVTSGAGALLVVLVLFLFLRASRRDEHARAVLAAQKELMKVTLLSIGDGVIATDIDGRVTAINPAATHLTGWTSTEAVGQPLSRVFEIVNEDTREPVDSPAARALKEGVVVGLANHTVLISRNRSECAIEDSAAPIRTADGKVVGCILVFHDATANRVAEAAVRTQLAETLKFHTLFDQGDHFSCILDLDGTVIEANQCACDGSGYPRDHVIGRKFWDGPWWDQSTNVHSELQAAMATVVTGHPFHIEVPYRYATGAERMLDLRILPVRDDTGKVVFIAPTGADITARIEAEGERKQLEADLRHLAADLSETSHRKDEFLATLAHELRNPLAPIRNGLRILALAGNNSAASDKLVDQTRHMMERQLGQMVRLVDDLLDVSRISRGKQELQLEQVDLSATLRNAIETSRPFIEDRDHRLKVMMTDAPVFVNGDPTRLEQVFTNLLNNAAKYSPPGAEIVLGLTAMDGEAIVQVRDTGIGIPSAALLKIFDLFMQVDHALDRAEGGLGIGLTLVKRLVEMHGGSVEARSEGTGKGSEFLVRLPTLDASTIVRDNTIEFPRRRVISKTARVVIADDNGDAADTLASLLKLMGHETVTANDGATAFEAVSDFRPELVLLDIGMPRLNGYEVCQRIRAQPWGKSMVIVALTGWGQESDKKRSAEAGFDRHMVKPIDPVALEDVLAEIR